MKTKRTIVNINQETYNKLRDYCKKNGLKIVWIVDKIINDYVNENNKKM